MVLVLQTEFSERQVNHAVLVWLETMPLHQHVEHRHRKRQSRLEIRPDPMHHLLEVADQCEHGQHRLNQHPRIPRIAITDFHVRGIARFSVKAVINQHDHDFIVLLNERLKGLVGHIGGITIPGGDQPKLIQGET